MDAGTVVIVTAAFAVALVAVYFYRRWQWNRNNTMVRGKR